MLSAGSAQRLLGAEERQRGGAARRRQPEQLHACAAECSSVSLWIINMYLSHILFMCYFLFYPSGTFRSRRAAGSTRVNVAQSARATTYSVFQLPADSTFSARPTMTNLQVPAIHFQWKPFIMYCVTKLRCCGCSRLLQHWFTRLCCQNMKHAGKLPLIHMGAFTTLSDTRSVYFTVPLWTCRWLLTLRWWAGNVFVPSFAQECSSKWKLVRWTHSSWCEQQKCNY